MVRSFQPTIATSAASRTSGVDFTRAENHVDIWQIDIGGDADSIQERRLLLSTDELQRADRFHFDKHRRRFIKARAAMRQILGGYAGVTAKELTFSYGARGKPELSGAAESIGIKFNLSHSDDVAMLAVTRGLTVGIDIERINPEFATEEIAERFFAKGEIECLQALPIAERADSFFSCWTRKEAYIKALGDGLSVPLDSFEVAFGPGIGAALLQVKTDPREVSRWSMYDLETAQGFRAALVVEGRGHGLRPRAW
jgi:4'-phosphopantetheinyl transferase